MNRGVCIRRSCLAKASLLCQVTSPARSAAPNPAAGGDPPIVLVPVGRLPLLSQHQPGCDGGQVLAESVAASSKAVGWCHWCSLGVGASLGFAPCLSFWEAQEKTFDWQPSC